MSQWLYLHQDTKEGAPPLNAVPKPAADGSWAYTPDKSMSYVATRDDNGTFDHAVQGHNPALQLKRRYDTVINGEHILNVTLKSGAVFHPRNTYVTPQKPLGGVSVAAPTVYIKLTDNFLKSKPQGLRIFADKLKVEGTDGIESSPSESDLRNKYPGIFDIKPFAEAAKEAAFSDAYTALIANEPQTTTNTIVAGLREQLNMTALPQIPARK
jgi:hypothetical protein